MTRLIRWIEDAEARQFCRDTNCNWRSGSTTDRVAGILINTAGTIFWLALICLPLATRF